jgi:hypothetical protein
VLTQNVLLQAPESTPWASKWQAARAGTFTPQR